jgi:hypothetical protein
MTVDGPDERPLALRDLAQADSPEIVRAALARFRRRLLTRGLILVLIVAVGLFLYPRYHRGPEDLASEIRHGRGVDLARILRTDGLEPTVSRVARLARQDIGQSGPVERYGIQLFVRPLATYEAQQIATFVRSDSAHGVLSVRSEWSNFTGGSIEIWISIEAGTRAVDIPIGEIRMDSASRKPTVSLLGTVRIDMEQLGVPDWTWR